MVRRRTEYESLLMEHGTPQMAEFRLEQRGVSVKEVEQHHLAVLQAAELVLGRVPTTWRKTWVLREDLDRFRFDPEDLIVAVGLDGLVPNVAKYLTGQSVIGVNPLGWAQRMMHFVPEEIAGLYSNKTLPLERRTMVRAELDDGRSILALNEVFCGHRSHQSAKYDLKYDVETEYQSSSGLIVTTGTGATGWASSIAKASGLKAGALPAPTDPSIYFMVREAWASSFTGSGLTTGSVGAARGLVVTSKMQEGGLLFGDGIESDALKFEWGQRVQFSVAERTLNLVTKSRKKTAKAAKR
ncbi:MAG: hypothetical protein ACJAYU_001427 [Bradymonadia bacterium]|jgi:hypothetical protein